MGCPSLYVWALIAAAYTTVQSFGFLSLNTLLILIHADVYKDPTGFFGNIFLYTLPSDTLHGDLANNCTVPEGKVSPESVVAYQYTYLVFHVLWIISGLIIISQLCRMTRFLWDYVMWMVVAVILLLLDTITGIFFIVERAGVGPEDHCQKAAFCMILLSFRWFIFYIINIACVVVVALTMRRHKTGAREPDNNYLDPPSTRKRLQSDNQEIGPPAARSRKPPAALPTETIEENDEHNYLGERVQTESEITNQFGPGDQDAPADNVPQTSFRTHSPIQVQQVDYLSPTTHNWQEIPLDQHRYPMSDPHPQTGDENNYPTSQQSLDNTNNILMPQEEQYPYSYAAAGRPGHDPRRSMDQDEQPFERLGLHSERQGDFARSQFDDEQRHMPPPLSRYAYDNRAWASDAPYLEDDFLHEAQSPQGEHRPPPRTKRNASNRRKRAAPQPKETPVEDSIEEEKEEEAPKPPKVTSLAPTASFDPRPFSYLNPTFRPTDHADVKAMKSHTADIVKTLDQETKQLKEKDMKSESSDSETLGIISSPPVRNYLNDSGRRNKVKKSTSLREQLARSGKAAARQQSFNKQSPNRSNAQRDLDSIEESNTRDSVADSVRPGRTAVEKDEQRRPYGDDTRRPRGGDRDHGAQRRPHNDREQDRRHVRRDQTDDANEDDYDSSDDEDEEEPFSAPSVSVSRHREPVFITAV